MPLVTEAGIFQGIYARAQATADFATASPGGIHYQRKPIGKSSPYCVAIVEGREFLPDSSNKPLLTFAVTLTGWTASTTTPPGPVAEAIDKVMRSLTTADIPNATALIRVWHQPGALSLPVELRGGQDVLALHRRWLVQVECQNAN